MHVMPEGIDYGVIDDTAARGNGSFSRSTRALELEHGRAFRPGSSSRCRSMSLMSEGLDVRYDVFYEMAVHHLDQICPRTSRLLLHQVQQKST